MTLLDQDLASAPATAASTEARRNYGSNLTALAASQPEVAAQLKAQPPSLTWTYARDGSLTAHNSAGCWWAGCSLPRRAGKALLQKLDLRGVVGCFLAPTHAGQIEAGLEKLEQHQAILVLQPDEEELAVSLGCSDFSVDISRHRLWFATGRDWAKMIASLFADHPGLPTPSQFIRTSTTSDDLVNQLIPAAEKLFSEINTARADRLQSISASSGTAKRKRVALIAPSHFRLWDDAGAALVDALGDNDALHLDPDDPAQSSALGLALAAQEAQVIITADRSRADLPAVLPASVAVISWITQPRIPAHDAAHPRDGLLLADESWRAIAQAAGWPADRLKLAGWPALKLQPSSGSSLALIADTSSLDTPIATLEHSSHHVLWELIRGDLTDPFALGPDVNSFINCRMVKLGISEEGFDRALFITKLVIPAYQQGLAKLLLDAGIPLKVYGSGWDYLPQFESSSQGPIKSRPDFVAAIESVAALVYPWPIRHAHFVDALGRTILSPGTRRSDYLRNAKAIAPVTPPTSTIPTLSRGLLDTFLS